MSGDVLSNLDSIVDGKNIRSRSEAIEVIVSRYLESNKVAVFLGGGDPNNLKIGQIFRPLIKVNNKPLIAYTLQNLRKAGYRNIFFIAENELIGEMFKEIGDGSDYGVRIKYVEEKKPLGEMKTLQLVENEINSPFLVLQIDNYFTFNLNKLFRAFTLNKGVMTLAVHARMDIKHRRGVVEMNGAQINSYEENPKDPKSTLASTTIAMCDPSIFNFIPKGDIKVKKQSIFDKLIQQNTLNGFIISGPWFNVHENQDVRDMEKYIEKSVTE